MNLSKFDKDVKTAMLSENPVIAAAEAARTGAGLTMNGQKIPTVHDVVSELVELLDDALALAAGKEGDALYNHELIRIIDAKDRILGVE